MTQSDKSQVEDTGGFHFTVALVIVFALLASLVLAIAYLYFPLNVRDGSLIGSDSYYWMVTFREFIETGVWHNDVIERSNAPFGESWFRPHPLQILLLTLFRPLNLFLGTDASFHLTGILIAPIQGISLCIAAAWAAKPILGRDRYWIMPMLFLQFPVLAQFLPGLVDHHTLLHLTLVMSLGLVFRLLTANRKLTLAFIAGCVHGFGLWVSVEMFTLLIMTYGCGAALWVLAAPAGSNVPPPSKWHVSFGLGLLLVITLAIAIEHPSDQWLSPEYDRLSVVHLLMASLALGAWSFIDSVHRSRMAPKSPAGRVALLGIACGGALVIMYAVFPDFFLGPLARTDPALRPLLHAVTGEMMPVYRHSPLIIASQIGLNFVALPLAIWIAIATRDDWRIRSCWVLVAVGLALFMVLMLVHVRFSAFVSCLAVFPLAWALGKTIEYTRTNLGTAGGLPIRAVAILGLVAGAGTLPLSVITPGENPLAACQFKDIAPLLNNLKGTKTILASPFDGPELLYFTRHRVVGTPYHRNGRAIVDTHKILSDRTDETARSIVETRGIDLIFLCIGREFDIYDKSGDSGTLYRRLMDKTPPEWIRPVKLPRPLSETFLLYEVPR